MSALAPFQYGEQDVRAFLVDDEPWFVAADVARILGYREAYVMTRRLDPEDKGPRSVWTPGGDQQMTCINEPGLYVAVLGSQVEGARAFKRWITHEVLPALRKTGTYSVTPALPQDYASALRELAASVEATQAAEAKVAELEPAASAWSVMACAAGDYSVDEAAKILCRDPQIKTGRQRLFGTMADLGWVYRHGLRRRWHAYQTAVETGRLVEKMSAAFMNTRTGEMENPAPTIRITAKGLEHLHRHLTGVTK